MIYKTSRFLAVSSALFISSFRATTHSSHLSLFAKAAFSTSPPTYTCSSAFSTTTTTMSKPFIRVIPNDKLYVSEPNPQMFGNGPNPSAWNNGNDKHWTNSNWLKSRFHFSFAEYSNHRNSQYGVVRVLNDDLVQPQRGFGSHPHRDMEILTYIVHGELTHQDSHGNKETLGRGSIQFMTAGTGIVHSEFNHHDTKPLRFIQTWVLPSERSLPPNYGSYNAAAPKAFNEEEEEVSASAKKNELFHLASNVKNSDKSTMSTPVKVNQDMNAYVAELEMGHSVDLKLQSGRQAYLLCIEGGVTVNGNQLKKYDACEIVNKNDGGDDKQEDAVVTIQATETEATENGDLALILIFEMKHVPGSGRSDL